MDLSNYYSINNHNLSQKKESFISELSLVIFSIVKYYSKFLKAKKICIYKNQFKLKNLYKYCYLKNYEDENRDKNITFEHNQIKIKKMTNILYNFRNIINILLDNFLHYSIIFINFFKVIFSFLFWFLLFFYSKICYYSHIYN